jgi:hypothetical protein
MGQHGAAIALEIRISWYMTKCLWRNRTHHRVHRRGGCQAQVAVVQASSFTPNFPVNHRNG